MGHSRDPLVVATPVTRGSRRRTSIIQLEIRMKKRTVVRTGLWMTLLGVVALAMAPIGDAVVRHERKEVAGLAVVFGAEPEPALTEEMQFLRWRVSTLSDEEPYSDFQDAKVTVTRDGEEFGPFEVRGVRPRPGSTRRVTSLRKPASTSRS